MYTILGLSYLLIMQATGFCILKIFGFYHGARITDVLDSDNQYSVGWYLSSVIYYKVIV